MRRPRASVGFDNLAYSQPRSAFLRSPTKKSRPVLAAFYRQIRIGEMKPCSTRGVAKTRARHARLPKERNSVMKYMKVVTQFSVLLAVVWAFHSADAGEPLQGSNRRYLLVPDYDKHNVLRFDAATGAFVDEFVPRQSGGLNLPWIALIGPHDGNIYVSSGHFRGPGQIKAVLRYDGTTGAFLDQFVQPGQMDMAHSDMYGPDGTL